MPWPAGASVGLRHRVAPSGGDAVRAEHLELVEGAVADVRDEQLPARRRTRASASGGRGRPSG